jgi:aminoglycoside phosphotransferase (APT) family kinase protein
VLRLTDGRQVILQEKASVGSKSATFFGTVGSIPVVVKIQRTHSDLSAEEAALQFLSDQPVHVPRVLGSGRDEQRRQFLVLSREPGSHPSSPAGWWRLGHDLAGLTEISGDAAPFRHVSPAEFAQDHRERLKVVRQLLTEDLVEQISVALTSVAAVDLTVLSHGDPGGGNYLDNPDGYGVQLDWETVTVSPFGLDLGRAAFIGLLDLGNSGVPTQLAAAVIDGYTSAVGPLYEIGEELRQSWIIVAGLQFIPGRHLQPLVAERTPQAAAAVLAEYLRSV